MPVRRHVPQPGAAPGSSGRSAAPDRFDQPRPQHRVQLPAALVRNGSEGHTHLLSDRATATRPRAMPEPYVSALLLIASHLALHQVRTPFEGRRASATPVPSGSSLRTVTWAPDQRRTRGCGSPVGPTCPCPGPETTDAGTPFRFSVSASRLCADRHSPGVSAHWTGCRCPPGPAPAVRATATSSGCSQAGTMSSHLASAAG